MPSPIVGKTYRFEDDKGRCLAGGDVIKGSQIGMRLDAEATLCDKYGSWQLRAIEERPKRLQSWTARTRKNSGSRVELHSSLALWKVRYE